MSADNWAMCPKCMATKEDKPSPYGKVSEEEYQTYVRDEEQGWKGFKKKIGL